MAVLLSVSLDLTVNHLRSYLYLVVGDSIFLTYLSIELGGKSNVKIESLVIVIQTHSGLFLLIGKRLTQHIDLIVFNVTEYLLLKELVDFIGLDRLPVHLLDKAHGNHTRAESRHLDFLSGIFERLVYILLIISLLHADGKQALYLAYILKLYVHSVFIVLNYFAFFY